MRRKIQSGLGITFRFQGSRTKRRLPFLSYTSLLCFPLRRDIVDLCPSYALRSVSSSAAAGSSAPLISSARLVRGPKLPICWVVEVKTSSQYLGVNSAPGHASSFWVARPVHSSAVHPVISHHKHFSISDQVAIALSGPLLLLRIFLERRSSHPSCWYFDTFSSSRSLAQDPGLPDPIDRKEAGLSSLPSGLPASFQGLADLASSSSDGCQALVRWGRSPGDPFSLPLFGGSC